MNTVGKYQGVADLIRSSTKTVVLTGAGMSTESGLKDFRGIGGMWKDRSLEQLAHVDSLRYDGGSLESARVLRDFHDFYKERIREVMSHEPHEGHRILAKWEAEDRISHVLTQNVDEYHQAAGSKRVVDLHGRLRDVHLHVSKRRISLDQYLGCYSPETRNMDVMRPGVVLFGEPLAMIDDARVVSEDADLMLIIGSSMKVGPVNTLPIPMLERGGKVVQINNESTMYDQFSAFNINEVSIRTALREIESLLNPTD